MNLVFLHGPEGLENGTKLELQTVLRVLGNILSKHMNSENVAG